MNFPIRPYETHATSYDAKGTYQVTPNHRLVLFGQFGRTREPDRLDPFGPIGGTLNSSTAINASGATTLAQTVAGWVGKGEWTAIIGNNTAFEIRAGAFGADQSQSPNGTTPRFEDLGTLVVSGGNRSWGSSLRRPQILGSLSHVEPAWFGRHTFKIGGEIVQTTSGERWRRGYPGDVLHVLRNGRPTEVYLFETPSMSESGLRTSSGYATDTWQMNARCTLNLGLRFDRYRVFLPAATHPAGRFNPSAQLFPAVDDVIDWNTFAPRLGLVVALSHDGRTLGKIHYGLYRYSPGTELGFSRQSQPKRVVASVRVVRRQRQRCLGSRRGRAAARESWRRCARISRSKSRAPGDARSRRVDRTGASGQRGAPDERRMARGAAALRAPGRESPVRRLHGAGHAQRSGYGRHARIERRWFVDSGL